MKEVSYKDAREMRDAYVKAVVDAATEIYQTRGHKPVRILDLATGGSQHNPFLVRSLADKAIEYELVLSDISPSILQLGYERIKEEIPAKELGNVRCVLADARDFRKDLSEVKLWHLQNIGPNDVRGKAEVKSLGEVLLDPKYQFLQTGYQNGRRLVDFSDETFDLVIGTIPYGSIQKDYKDAIRESIRLLKPGGYHIVEEMQVEELRSRRLRTLETLKEISRKPLKESYSAARNSISAFSEAKPGHISEVKRELDFGLKPIAIYSAIYEKRTGERSPDMVIQHGDLIKEAVMVYRKSL